MKQRRWLTIVAVVWSTLVAIIPATFGVILLTRPAAITTASLTAAHVLVAMAYRNFAFSVVLLGALVLHGSGRRIPAALAALLAVRGLTELADGLSGVFAAGPGPFIGAAGDLFFAAYFALQVPPRDGRG